ADKLTAFKSRFEERLTRDWEEIRKFKNPFFSEKIAKGDAVEVAFFGIENGIPTLGTIAYHLTSQPTEPVRIAPHVETCPGIYPSDVVMTSMLGRNQEIVALSRDPGFWTQGPVNGVRKMVETESRAASDEVGGPISILYVDRYGAEWKQRGECQEIKDYPHDARP